MKYEIHGVLAGAYAKLKTVLTHATDTTWQPLCKAVKPENICDVEVPGPPTCPKCQERLRARLRRILRARGVPDVLFHATEVNEICSILRIDVEQAMAIEAATSRSHRRGP